MPSISVNQSPDHFPISSPRETPRPSKLRRHFVLHFIVDLNLKLISYLILARKDGGNSIAISAEKNDGELCTFE
jgi:hypothetical protein